MNPQPKIVPIVLANFDLLPEYTEYKCQIMPPFQMSDYGINDPKDIRIDQVVQTINRRYKKWVKKLCVAGKKILNKKLRSYSGEVNKKQLQNLIVFYGSSTIRLWERLQKDFPDYHTLNLASLWWGIY